MDVNRTTVVSAPHPQHSCYLGWGGSLLIPWGSGELGVIHPFLGTLTQKAADCNVGARWWSPFLLEDLEPNQVFLVLTARIPILTDWKIQPVAGYPNIVFTILQIRKLRPER